MQIQELKKNELKLFYHYAKIEGWNLEEAHTSALLKAHPNDFFIAYKDKVLIGFIVALKHSDTFGFISSFLVLEEFRSLGYGKEIFEFALKYLEGCQIALDSVLGQEAFYEKYSFKTYFDTITYKFEVGTVLLPKNDIEIVGINSINYTLIQDVYLQEMLQNKGVHYQFVKNPLEKPSYAFSFTYMDGYKISIGSSDINEAISLFFSLIKGMDNGTPIYIQTMQLAPVVMALVEVLKMSESSKFTRMYNKLLD